jgi:hypothetical protein
MTSREEILVTVGQGIGVAMGHAMLRGGVAHFDTNPVIAQARDVADEMEIAGDRSAAEAIRHEIARSRGVLDGPIEGDPLEVAERILPLLEAGDEPR